MAVVILYFCHPLQRSRMDFDFMDFDFLDFDFMDFECLVDNGYDAKTGMPVW